MSLHMQRTILIGRRGLLNAVAGVVRGRDVILHGVWQATMYLIGGIRNYGWLWRME